VHNPTVGQIGHVLGPVTITYRWK